MNNKLEPVKCRCGGEAIVDRNGPNWTVIHCEKCGIHLNNFNTEAEAIIAWNKVMGERTAKVVEGQKGSWYCTGCGKWCDKGEDIYCAYCGARLEWK